MGLPGPSGATTEWVVESSSAGLRLDVFLAEKQSDLTRSRLKSLIEAGDVAVNGRAPKASYKLKSGDRVGLTVPPVRPARPEAEDLPFGILYEDADLVVVNKPPGLVVHPAAGVDRGTLVNALLFHIKDLQGIGGEMRPGLVHRLDRDTSGAMVVAKTDAALASLQAAFKRRDVEKQYVAIVHGKPPDRGTFDTAYGRHPKDRKRFSSKVKEGKQAVTHFAVRRRWPGFAEVEVRLETGRTHQIRVHFSDAGFPLLHDSAYGGTKREEKLDDPLVSAASSAMGRQALHAQVLAFPHPTTGRVLRIEAPLPADFRAALTALEAIPVPVALSNRTKY